jgi:hypothetical protein
MTNKTVLYLKIISNILLVPSKNTGSFFNKVRWGFSFNRLYKDEGCVDKSR